MKKIIVISAVWCPSCLILKKDLKRIKQEYKNIEIVTLDFDFDEDEVSKYNVKDKLPVIIAEENDKELNRLVGEKNYSEIVNFLKESEIVWKRK